MSEELKVGDRLKDNDPRMGHRGELVVSSLTPNGVYLRDVSGRVFGVLRRRVHTDDKPRRSGFSLVR